MRKFVCCLCILRAYSWVECQLTQHISSKNVSAQNRGSRPSCYSLQCCSEITVTCPLKTIFRTTFSSIKNVLSNNLNSLNICPYLHITLKLRNESTKVSSISCCQYSIIELVWICKILLGIQWYKSDLKTDSLLQVQEGPETDCRWALKAFTKGDKAYFVHSEGVW